MHEFFQLHALEFRSFMTGDRCNPSSEASEDNGVCAD